MSTTLRKVVLVGGSGHLGPHLLKALQSDSAFDVTVVSRQSSQAQFPSGTNVIRVSDKYPKHELLDIFKGQDAVVLSLNWAAEAEHHNTLVDASVEAGVKRLVPSIWGGRIDIPGAKDVFPFAASKASMLEYVKARVPSTAEWSYTAVSCGLFHDLCVQTNFYGIDPVARSATIWDEGNTRFSVSTGSTIGLCLTRILSKSEETKNRTVYISSFETTMNELLSAYTSATGVSDWVVAHKEVEQGVKEAKETSASSSDFMARMRAIGLLGLLVGLKKGLGGDFVGSGIADNELLGLPREDVTATVASILNS